MTLAQPANLFTKIKQNWDLVWSNLANPWFESSEFVNQVLSFFLPYIKSGVLVDLGCGRGKYLEVLRHSSYKLYGLDISFHCLREVRGVKNCRLIQADADYIPLIKGSVDGVIVALLLEHMKKINQVLSEIYRTLKPGGACITVSPNRFSVVSLYIIFKPLLNLFGYWKRSPKVHIARSAFALKGEMIKTGFKVEEVRYLSLAGYRKDWLSRLVGLVTKWFPLFREEIVVIISKPH